jgi:hypothetical protein
MGRITRAMLRKAGLSKKYVRGLYEWNSDRPDKRELPIKFYEVALIRKNGTVDEYVGPGASIMDFLINGV